MKTDFGIYLHIPFCVRKCRYCDFLSYPAGAAERAEYADALVREIRMAGAAYGGGTIGEGRAVDTVFVGGGTPSVLAGDVLRRIFEALWESFSVRDDAEVSIEINPGTLRSEHLPVLHDYVNRVSMGLQSAQEEELRMLGRIHSFADFRKSWEMLEEAGVRNRNADLMFGIPGQTRESFADTLKKVLALHPEHLSIYSLILEEGTEMARLYEAGAVVLPDEDAERDMQETAISMAEAAGLWRYEISNFARDGFESRHNMRYWMCRDYLGIGLGASSCMDGVRWKNTEEMREYRELLRSDARDGSGLRGIQRERHALTVREQMEEFLFLGLRMTRGVRKADFSERFGRPVGSVFGEQIAKLSGEGLLVSTPERLYLTPYGLDVSNRVFAEFLS